ncbi:MULTISPECIES: PAS domain S-box protein [unclassified Paenibacillus]|uniref:sensor histidine kinase n=1 Tax=unclassified Paenibacillus TaxID=185978 RepID=UPI0024058974|nr:MULTISPECIES: PAS domain S-box protein [unclassified Paenibacillus]MDF9839504.1 PAS domain S-box-containing protein [Paenibacillus sp. PastF-2]MDF9846085.1 PAS domain S-box-containing protein [Paenibacillus sp. PastM-2]MDF9852658.1 PAS domain S-box-containing protein [Paenibacillus sp. PastF-1]MDH6477611.1 PAS domain S-box-containing protein [Paenibacillus sp. PastH-2]MDH6505354.1 PAS domain S-box-containing protein [Paenibacillus sp. PastM-3]
MNIQKATDLLLLSASVLLLWVAAVYKIRHARQAVKLETAEMNAGYYKSLLQHHTDAIFELNLHGKVTAINPVAQQLVDGAGVAPLGAFIYELALPRNREMVKDAFFKASRGHTVVLENTPVQMGSKQTYWRTTYSPAYRHGSICGVFVVAANRTEYAEMQLQLNKQKTRYERVAASLPDMVFVLTPRLVPTYVSPSFEEILGYAKGSYLYRYPVTDYLSPEAAAPIQAKFGQLIGGEREIHFEFRFFHADGTEVYLEGNGTALTDSGGTVEKLVIVVRDITDRKRAEQTVIDSEHLYLRLQNSLHRFTEDVSFMMNPMELERRLCTEFQEVLRVPSQAIIQTTGFRHFACHTGVFPPDAEIKRLETFNGIRMPVGELFRLDRSVCFVVGELRGIICLAWIGDAGAWTENKAIRAWIQTLARYTSAVYENMMKIKDLTAELEMLSQRHRTPSWLLRLMYAVSEKERKHLSQDLHDSALQEQIIWYRKLDMLQYSPHVNADLKPELHRIGEGMLDVMYQIRATCNELRPPFLKEWGLTQALETLYEQVQMRSDFQIHFNSDGFKAKLPDEQMLALYRINQELLNNAVKHSFAKDVNITLVNHDDGILMLYQDNGIGLPSAQLEDVYARMGLYGIKERIRSLDGDCELESCPGEGLTVHVYLPGHHSSKNTMFPDTMIMEESE